MSEEFKGRRIQSVERAMTILETIAGAEEIGVTEIADQLELHVATVHNLLRTLASMRYLTNVGGRYRIGPAMKNLALRWDPLKELPPQIQPYLQKCTQATGEASSATILIGTTAHLVAFQAGLNPITIQFPQWVWPQAAGLATGRLLIAYLPEEQWVRFIEINSSLEPEWSARQWREEFARIRKHGYYFQTDVKDSGLTRVVLPIFAKGGLPIAAIGQSVPSFRATPELCDRMMGSLFDATKELSREFGFFEAITRPKIDWNKLL